MFSFGHRVRVRIHPLFFCMALFIGWMNSLSVQGTALWVGVIFCSVLLHEYGHAGTALFFGQRPHIELIGFGGVTQRQGPRLKLWQEFFVVLNGPLVGLLLGTLAYQLLKQMGNHPSLPREILYIAFYVNVFWTVLNLLPIYPLDGGHLLGIVLEALFGFRGYKIALFLSLALGGLLSVFFFITHALLAGSIFLMLAFESYRAWQQSLAVKKEDHNVNLQHLLQLAEQNKEQGYVQEAIDQLQTVRQSTQGGLLHTKATEELGLIFFEEGAFEEVYNLLMPVKKRLSSEGIALLQQAAYRLKKWKEALSLGESLYRLSPNAEVAVLNARSAAMLGETSPTLGWLQRAKKDGAEDLEEILHAPEFDAVRQQLQDSTRD